MKLKALLAKLFATHTAIAGAVTLPKEQMIGDEKFQTAIIDAKRLPDVHEEILAALAEDETSIGAAALETAIKAGTHLRKEDHETAITAAKKTATEELQASFKTAAEAKDFAAGKRTELAKLITAEAAALITDERLTKDTAEATIALITARAEALNGKGITLESLPNAFKTVASVVEPVLYEACMEPVITVWASKGKVDAKASVTPPKVDVQGKPVDVEGQKTELPMSALV